jgi:hypothetical protein
MPESMRPEPSRFYRWMVLIFVSWQCLNCHVRRVKPPADVLKVRRSFSDSNIGPLQAIYSFPTYLP